MIFRQSVPEYLTNKKNTIIQIAFTTIFAYIFINSYRPFGFDDWYKINDWQLLIVSAIVVVAGMIVIILSRLVFFQIKKSHEITTALYAWFIAAEIFLMGLFYTSLEIFILDDKRRALDILFNAVQNTALLLLIPYTVSSLFFAWKDIKKKFEQVITQFREPSELFIPLKDEKGQLRLTIKLVDLLYFESNDNYVNVHYMDGEKKKVYMVRSSLKRFEEEFENYPIYRNHRKYAVNIKNVKSMKRAKSGYILLLNTNDEDSIPVSRSYEKQITELMK